MVRCCKRGILLCHDDKRLISCFRFLQRSQLVYTNIRRRHSRKRVLAAFVSCRTFLVLQMGGNQPLYHKGDGSYVASTARFSHYPTLVDLESQQLVCTGDRDVGNRHARWLIWISGMRFLKRKNVAILCYYRREDRCSDFLQLQTAHNSPNRWSVLLWTPSMSVFPTFCSLWSMLPCIFQG